MSPVDQRRPAEVTDALTSKPRPPRRRSPAPQLFQYHVLHAPFGKRPGRGS